MRFIIDNIVYFIGLFFALITPIKDVMFVVGVLVVVDTLFGLAAAKKLKINIESRKLGRVITKLLAYQLLIISAVLVNNIAENIPFVKITAGFIGVVEFLSIGENFTKLTGLKFISYLKKQLQSFIEIEKKGK